MLDEVLHFKGLAAGDAINAVRVKHFQYKSRGWSISSVEFLAYLALFLIVLKVLVVQLHIQAVAAVQLSTFRVVTLDRCIHDF